MRNPICFEFSLYLLLVQGAVSLSQGIVDVPDPALRYIFKRIHKQDEKITKSQVQATQDLQNLSSQISILERKLEVSCSKQKELEKTLENLVKSIAELENKEQKNSVPDYVIQNSTVSDQGPFVMGLKQKRNLVNRSYSDHATAFYAYLSKRVKSPCVHQTLIFDTVITNVGGSYNRHDGVFTAPVTGVYVFNWNIYSSFKGDITSELMVNSVRKGGQRSDSRVTNEDHSSSGCVVVSIRRGDVVFIRIHPTHTLNGGIISYPGVYESSFSGWLLK